MELIEATDDTITLRMKRSDFRNLCDVLRTAAIDYDALDSEILMLSRDQVSTLNDQAHAVVSQTLAQQGFSMAAFTAMMKQGRA
jgi:hypothetical protein